ncbi:hypothetical protein ACFYSH_19550 [Streptomyces sp. NPDC005791]|uniref:hypothetical protein n=1 Tax=Streptomyces sp. NPDC005791 TaxID=3364732 RepID=UPI00369FD867
MAFTPLSSHTARVSAGDGTLSMSRPEGGKEHCGLVPADTGGFQNAASEAFDSVLEGEYVNRHAFRARAVARIRAATWIPASTTPADCTACAGSRARATTRTTTGPGSPWVWLQGDRHLSDRG